MTSRMTKIASAIKKSIFATAALSAAMPVNPKMPATSEMRVVTKQLQVVSGHSRAKVAQLGVKAKTG